VELKNPAFILSFKYYFMQTRFLSASLVKLGLTITLFSVIFGCRKDCDNNSDSTVPFNLDVSLKSEGKSFGYIHFRQNTAHIISLDTWVFGLAANHSYLLQRAVDELDDNCTSTTWLTLGKGLQPQAIETDAFGNGEVELFRDVSAIPSGSTFDIHFQVIDAQSSSVVLTSNCYQYKVR
jgi:hypothetical protein